MPAQTRLRNVLEGAEAQHDAALGIVDLIEPRECPHGNQQHQGTAEEAASRAPAGATTRCTVTAAAAAQKSGQFSLQVPDDGIKARRTSIATGIPGVTLVSVVPPHRAIIPYSPNA